jgi:hypothetical protein
LPKEKNMTTWEGRTYEIALSTLGVEVVAPTFRFQFAPVPEEGTETYFYRVVPENEADPNPLEGYGFIAQGGRKLTKYIPSAERLDPESDNYLADLQDLVDEISGDKLAEDPFGYERLVGFIPHGEQRLNPVTIYPIEDVYADGSLMLLVRARIIGGDPNGGIVIIGRS